jgi:hypothetical protein
MKLGYELGRCKNLDPAFVGSAFLRLQSFSEKEKGFSPTQGARSLGVSVYFFFIVATVYGLTNII